MDPGEQFLEQVNAHQQIIHKVCNLYLRDPRERSDLFQEILLNAWKGYGNFKGDARFSTWLYRVALNTAVSYYRKENRNPLHHAVDVVHEPSPDPGPDQPGLETMYQAIGRLNAIDKAIVMLYIDGYNHAEAAESSASAPIISR